MSQREATRDKTSTLILQTDKRLFQTFLKLWKTKNPVDKTYHKQSTYEDLSILQTEDYFFTIH